MVEPYPTTESHIVDALHSLNHPILSYDTSKTIQLPRSWVASPSKELWENALSALHFPKDLLNVEWDLARNTCTLSLKYVPLEHCLKCSHKNCQYIYYYHFIQPYRCDAPTLPHFMVQPSKLSFQEELVFNELKDQIPRIGDVLFLCRAIEKSAFLNIVLLIDCHDVDWVHDYGKCLETVLQHHAMVQMYQQTCPLTTDSRAPEKVLWTIRRINDGIVIRTEWKIVVMIPESKANPDKTYYV